VGGGVGMSGSWRCLGKHRVTWDLAISSPMQVGLLLKCAGWSLRPSVMQAGWSLRPSVMQAGWSLRPSKMYSLAVLLTARSRTCGKKGARSECCAFLLRIINAWSHYFVVTLNGKLAKPRPRRGLKEKKVVNVMVWPSFNAQQHPFCPNPCGLQAIPRRLGRRSSSHCHCRHRRLFARRYRCQACGSCRNSPTCG
jgi:hypothetical protein